MTSVAILIGGRATRYGGRDKSLLTVEGRTILARQLDAAAAVSDEILLVGRPGTVLPPSPGRLVHDRVPDCGPLGGLDAALHASGGDAVLLLACDMPFVTGAFLRHLAETAAGVDAVVPRTERGYHPLCAVYAQTCREPVSRRLAARQLRMLDLLSEVRVRVVERRNIDEYGTPERLLANVNTPADFDELRALPGHKL